MRIISVKRLREFWMIYPQAEQPLKTWYQRTKAAQWQSPSDIKTRFPHASLVGNNRVIFNIGGNKYRLILEINYRKQIGYVRFVGTHREYECINVETIR